MDFDFLFQNFEGVLSLTKRKAKVLTFFSLAGLLVAILFTTIFAFNIDKSKYILSIIVLGCMMILNVFFLIQGNYNSAVRVVFILPLALYFLFINSYYSISSDEEALDGLLKFLYFGFVYLVLFSYSAWVIVFFYVEAIAILFYFLYFNNSLISFEFFGNGSTFSSIHPSIELTLIGTISLLFFLFYDDLITKTAKQSATNKKQLNEAYRQIDAGIMELQVQRDNHGEKSGMIIKRTNGYFNKTFKVTSEEVTNTEFSEIFPKIFRDSFNWQNVFFHASQHKLQVEIKHLEQWFLINNIYLENDITICFFTNITLLKEETNKLNIREKRLTTLMGSLPDIFFIIEKDGTYIDYVSNNPELIGISQKDIIGKTIFEMGFSKPMSYQIYSSIQFVLEHDNIETIEYGMELPSGKTLIFEMRLAKLNENQIISIGRDITAKKEYQFQLIEARRRTEEASRLKSSFLENISHEMRTPMNAIIGFSQMASSDRYTVDEKNNFQKIISKNSEYLMEIVTNVIDVSEIETGTITVRMKKVNVNELFFNLYQKFNVIVIDSKKEIKFNLLLGEKDSKFEINTDHYLLIKALNHLIGNAIKFTEEGLIVIGYELADKNIDIYIEDTGIGIDKKNTEAIFDFFYQADNRVSRKYSGTGVGLTIAKNLIEMIGGTLEFKTKLNQGSKFYFSLPINAYLNESENQ